MDPNFPDVILRPGSTKRCRVVYSYTPQNEDELELTVEDEIEFLSEVEEGWWRGRIKGQEGVFPSNFVVELSQPDDHSSEGDVSAPLSSPDEQVPVLPPKPVKEQCRVLFAYDAAIEDELTLKKDDIVTIITKDVEDKGWWKGELRGKIGLFPDNFVELIPTPEDVHITQQKKPERPAKNINDSKIDSKIPLISSVLASPKKNDIDTNNHTSPNLTSSSPTAKTNDHNEVAVKRMSGADLDIIKPDTVAAYRKSIEEKSANDVSKKPPLRPPISGKPKPPAAKPISVKRMSAEIDDHTDGVVASKTNRLKSSESESDELDLDSVGRSDMLSHITQSRPRAPGRRPPSVNIPKDVDIGLNLTNGNSEKSTEHIDKNNKENKWEKHKPPFMDELKVNLKSAKPAASTTTTNAEVKDRKTAPGALWGAKTNNQSTFETSSSSVSSHESNNSNVITKSVISNVELRQSTASVVSSHVNKVSELSSVFGDKAKVSAVHGLDRNNAVDSSEYASKNEVSELRLKVESLEKTVFELVHRLREESDKRRMIEKELNKLTDLVTQV